MQNPIAIIRQMQRDVSQVDESQVAEGFLTVLIPSSVATAVVLAAAGLPLFVALGVGLGLLGGAGGVLVATKDHATSGVTEVVATQGLLSLYYLWAMMIATFGGVALIAALSLPIEGAVTGLLAILYGSSVAFILWAVGEPLLLDEALDVSPF